MNFFMFWLIKVSENQTGSQQVLFVACLWKSIIRQKCQRWDSSTHADVNKGDARV